MGSFGLAARPGVSYGRCVLRRVVSSLALLAVLAAPAVSSTRLFCRYTGEEYFGCAESGVAPHAQARPDDCCDQRTSRALEGARLADNRATPVPAPFAISIDQVLFTAGFVPRTPAVEQRAAPSAGPPAFLSHRALLI